jgi:hypothetical protein
MISLRRRAQAAPIGQLAYGISRLAHFPTQQFDPGPSVRVFQKEHSTNEPIEG